MWLAVHGAARRLLKISNYYYAFQCNHHQIITIIMFIITIVNVAISIFAITTTIVLFIFLVVTIIIIIL